ncbi:MAG: HAD family hydrolase [Anaerolineaceae bacterium]|nr:HAD family hydrolase [Anaerolineaceae bacterium]
MTPKLIFLDVDGTLTLPGSYIIPESAMESLRRAQANGHHLFLCTGRNVPMITPLLEKFPFEGAVGGSGATILIGDHIIYDCPMEMEDFRTAMKLLEENHVYRTIESKYGAWCDAGIGEFLSKQSGGNSELERMRKAVEQDLGMKPMNEYPGCPIYKILFICESLAQLEPARAALGEKYHFMIQDAKPGSGCINGEITGSEYDKGSGIRMAADALGFDLKDTIGFGDSMNDVEMIQTVGFSVCMENGSPTLKAMSDMVCPSVEQDGLAKAFKTLGLI